MYTPCKSHANFMQLQPKLTWVCVTFAWNGHGMCIGWPDIRRSCITSTWAYRTMLAWHLPRVWVEPDELMYLTSCKLRFFYISIGFLIVTHAVDRTRTYFKQMQLFSLANIVNPMRTNVIRCHSVVTIKYCFKMMGSQLERQLQKSIVFCSHPEPSFALHDTTNWSYGTPSEHQGWDYSLAHNFSYPLASLSEDLCSNSRLRYSPKTSSSSSIPTSMHLVGCRAPSVARPEPEILWISVLR